METYATLSACSPRNTKTLYRTTAANETEVERKIDDARQWVNATNRRLVVTVVRVDGTVNSVRL